MKVEMTLGITLYHLTHIFHTLQGVHDAERVWQQETFYACVAQHVHQLIHILSRIAHARTPVLKIEVHIKSFLIRIFERSEYAFKMLLRRFLQLLGTMLE